MINAFSFYLATKLDKVNSRTPTHTRIPGFQPFGFQSGLYDGDTALVQFGARWYDAASGRWLSKDPILLEGGLNLYVFCGNDPVNFADPWGRCEEAGGFRGGWWNPMNWRRGLYTGDPRASDVFYGECIDAAGQTLIETYPGGGFAIGFSAQGGGSSGGQTGGGIVVALNWTDIIQGGLYGVAGGGAHVGSGGSITLDVSPHCYNDINQFSGSSLVVGGSWTIAGAAVGGEAVIPTNGSDGYVTFSVGAGLGTPGEGHVFVTRTWVNRVF